MRPITFSGNPLDRASYNRADPAWLAGPARGRPVPALLAEPAFRQRAEPRRVPAGTRRMGRQSLRLSGAGRRPAAVRRGSAAATPNRCCEGGEFQEMRAAAFVLPGARHRHRRPGQGAARLAQAPRLLPQLRPCHRNSPTPAISRICPNCGAEHFPRTDPVVIMLPILGDECLIGRNKRFPPLLYSAFAGFVEPGETHGRSGAPRTAGRSGAESRRGAAITPPSPGRFRHP